MFLILPKNHEKIIQVKKIIQNIGAIISSRNAEKFCLTKVLLTNFLRKKD
jgi:hypothetical protein